MDSITAYIDPRVYTEAEIERIKEWVDSGLSYTEIAANLPGRTIKSISVKIRSLGLTAQMTKRREDRGRRDYLTRLLRETAKEPLNENVEQDEAFQRALKKAVADGLEFVTEGISTAPCTENPKVIRPSMPVCLRSSALVCLEHGDNSRAIFA